MPYQPVRHIEVDEDEIQRVMHALAHPVRRRILLSLDIHYGTGIESLQSSIRKEEKRFLTRQGVHKHLMVLRKAKLVTGGAIGEEAVYHMDPLPIRRTFRDLGRLLKRRFPAGVYYRAVPWGPGEDEDVEAAAAMDEKAKDEAFMRMLNESEFE